MTYPNILTEKGLWDVTNGSGPHLDLSRTDVKLLQDVYQEMLDFNPGINAVGSIQDDDDVHVGLASCGKIQGFIKNLLVKGQIYGFTSSQLLPLRIYWEKK